MFSVTADGAEVKDGDSVYDTSGQRWIVRDLWLDHCDFSGVSADRSKVDKFYASKAAALRVGLDVEERRHKAALDAFSVATDQLRVARERMQKHVESKFDRINEAGAITF